MNGFRVPLKGSFKGTISYCKGELRLLKGPWDLILYPDLKQPTLLGLLIMISLYKSLTR